jgi:hypothetical protein
LELRKEFGVVPSQMVDDTDVIDQSAQIPCRQNEIEMIGAVTLLNHSKLAVDVPCLPLHIFKLLVGKSTNRFALFGHRCLFNVLERHCGIVDYARVRTY